MNLINLLEKVSPPDKPSLYKAQKINLKELHEKENLINLSKSTNLFQKFDEKKTHKQENQYSDLDDKFSNYFTDYDDNFSNYVLMGYNDLNKLDEYLIRKYKKIFKNIQNYLPIKNHKKIINPQLDEKISEANDRLADYIKYVESNKNNVEKIILFQRSKVFNHISFSEFKQICLLNMTRIKKYPIYTQFKLENELKKIEKKAKIFGAVSSTLLTPILSLVIPYYIYRNFSKQIRNKMQFYFRHLLKFPLVIMTVSYLFMKNASLLYYLRKPSIDLNNIYSEYHQKENINEEIKIIRLYPFEHQNYFYVNDIWQYENFIHGIYENEILLKKDDFGSVQKFSFNFLLPNLLYYKLLIWKLNFLRANYDYYKKYFNNIDILENKIKIDYFKNILFINNLHQKSLILIKKENILSRLVHIKKRYKSPFIFTLSSKRNKKNKFNRHLASIIEKAFEIVSIKERIQIFLNIYYLDLIHNTRDNKVSRRIIRYYQSEYVLDHLKHFLVNKSITSFSILKNISDNESLMREFLSKYNKTNKNKYRVYLPSEFITKDEFYKIGDQYNNLIANRSKIENIFLTGVILTGITQFWLLRYLKIIL
jgi:hypothetical protein